MPLTMWWILWKDVFSLTRLWCRQKHGRWQSDPGPTKIGGEKTPWYVMSEESFEMHNSVMYDGGLTLNILGIAFCHLMNSKWSLIIIAISPIHLWSIPHFIQYIKPEISISLDQNKQTNYKKFKVNPMTFIVTKEHWIFNCTNISAFWEGEVPCVGGTFTNVALMPRAPSKRRRIFKHVMNSLTRRPFPACHTACDARASKHWLVEAKRNAKSSEPAQKNTMICAHNAARQGLDPHHGVIIVMETWCHWSYSSCILRSISISLALDSTQIQNLHPNPNPKQIKS